MIRASAKLKAHFSRYIDNPFRRYIASVESYFGFHHFYGLAEMNDPKVNSLPFCIRILLENVMRHCDQFQVKSIDVLKVLNWQEASKEKLQIPFKPSRVLLQDFAGLSVMVDLAAMRDTMKEMGGNPLLINPQCPVHLVIDHSIQTQVTKTKNAADINQKLEFERNKERFEFLKWGSRAFKNLHIVPPGGGILHQVNLEYLAEVVVKSGDFIYPDTVVGTDSHTAMTNALGVLGWGVGGLEAQAVILGQTIPISLPQVIGVKFKNKLKEGVTATDLVLTLTKQLKGRNLKNNFIQFYGPGVDTLSVPQRATVSNMSFQYGATVAYFPVDKQVLKYLQETNRDYRQIQLIQNSFKYQKLLKTQKDEELIKYSSTVQIDLAKIEPSVAGPTRPFDWVSLSNVKSDWNNCLISERGVREFGVEKEKAPLTHKVKIKRYQQQLKNGSIIIASIDSCTNTVNPKVIIAAALLAKKAAMKGLKIKNYVKASFSPGSPIVAEYLEKSKLVGYLDTLGFHITGYGCMTCIGNSGEIQKQINEVVKRQNLVVCSVTSGNTNYQSKIHRRVKANYLMSPAHVVAYAIAGRIDIDFQTQPLGIKENGSQIFLKDIFPSDQQVKNVANTLTNRQMYKEVYDTIYSGTRRWNSIIMKQTVLYDWNKQSTYIQKPPYLQNINRKPKGIQSIKNAFVLAYFGDQITTDLISPSARITKNSLAGRYLFSKNVERKDFHTYGSRRGNSDVLVRGTFSNPVIINRLSPVVGPKTVFIPTGEVLDFIEASQKYKQLGHATMIIAGTLYGKGSVKDWAARGPYLLGVRVVIAQSYDEHHRLNLIEMGILPLEFMPQQSAQSLQLAGKQTYTINIPDKNLNHGQVLIVSTNTGKDFECRSRLDTDIQIQYYRHGGILPYNLRKLRNMPNYQ